MERKLGLVVNMRSETINETFNWGYKIQNNNNTTKNKIKARTIELL